jgi:hypothetical protein
MNKVRLVYAVAAEGEKTFINNIIINGVTGDRNTRRKKRAAILRAIPLAENDVLAPIKSLTPSASCISPTPIVR